MRCSRCGAQNPEGSLFCMNCGSSLPAEPAQMAPQPPDAVTQLQEPRAQPSETRGFPVKAFLIGLTAVVAVAVVAMVVVLVLRAQGPKEQVIVVASSTPTPWLVTVVVTPVAPGEEAAEIPAAEPTVIPAAESPTEAPPAESPTEVPPTAIPTEVPPTEPPTEIPPTEVSGPEIIPATQPSISVDGFECRVVQVAYDQAVFGSVPLNMGTGDQILFVEFEVLVGEKEAFANLTPGLVLESGAERAPVAWIGAGYVNMLSTMTYTGTPSEFSPGDDTVSLAYVVSQNPGNLLLAFDSGVQIDLTPVMP